ncbi:MAG TPA: hypothetical protein VMB66_11875 [Candidatus Acidoferrales bacterium]|nr:hypothetical protein [Candidatus Acidoferrales bacterium]
MPRIPVFLLCIVVLAISAARQMNAQQTAEAPSQQQPQVRVNMLNVCTPSAEEQKEIASALARVPREPLFGTDFEVSRGRSTLTEMPSFVPVGQRAHVTDEAPVASYVRMRREFSVQALFSSVQYSFSDDGQTMVETLVFHVRDPKDLIEVSLEDSASSVTNAASMLAADTPVSRVRLERFGKSSVALARCSATQNGPAPDQSAYEPLFQSASSLLTNYRGLLHVKAIVPEELAKISATGAKRRTAPKAKPPSEKK